MKLTCYLHMYPPLHMAGSETTVHAAMRAMVERGHDVTVIADRTPEDYEFEGVKVKSLPKTQYHHTTVREIAKDADLLITHLDCTSLAMSLAVDLHKPLVHFVHNHAQLAYWNTPPHKAQLVVFNSHWVAMNETYKGEPWPGESVIIHPIIEPDKYRCERGTKITFCNPTEGKGVETVHRLAEAMPDYEFLIVEGIYGEQVAPPNLSDEWVAAHPNIEHMKNTPDFREVLRKTKVLLMPSNYESYGRCAVEAACAGIPSIVHPTQGLWEALGDGRRYPAVYTEYGVAGNVVTSHETLPAGLFDGGLVNGAGIFCDRKDTLSWKAQIERLYTDEVYYRNRVDAAVKLADSLDPEGDFDRLEIALSETYAEWQCGEVLKLNKVLLSNCRFGRREDGTLTSNMAEARSLVCGGPDMEIPAQDEEEAKRLGFVQVPAVQTEVLLDTSKLDPHRGKAIEAPAENKAIESPAENKAKGKKKKVA